MKRLPLSPARVARLALALLAAWGPASAATAPADEASPAAIHPLVGGMLTGTIGADKSTVVNPDGGVASGSLSGRYEAFAGAEFPVDPNGLSVRLTVGYHVTGPFKGDGSEHMTSVPLEATLWYPINEQLRVNAGARYAMRNRFDGAGRHTSDGINSTPALVAGVGVRLMPHLELELRYIYQRYEQPTGGDLEASHWGVGLAALY